MDYTPILDIVLGAYKFDSDRLQCCLHKWTDSDPPLSDDDKALLAIMEWLGFEDYEPGDLIAAVRAYDANPEAYQ